METKTKRGEQSPKSYLGRTIKKTTPHGNAVVVKFSLLKSLPLSAKAVQAISRRGLDATHPMLIYEDGNNPTVDKIVSVYRCNVLLESARPSVWFPVAYQCRLNVAVWDETIRSDSLSWRTDKAITPGSESEAIEIEEIDLMARFVRHRQE